MWSSPSATRSPSFRISSAGCRNRKSIKSWAARFPREASQTAGPNEVFVEAEAKRLTASFRPLYHALARRRLTHLAHEPNSAQRPGVYEFPREFKRIRSPLVQFLTDVFRPNSLGPSLALRGYYLTGARETEVERAVPAGMTDTVTQAPMEATRLFRGDATQMFQGDDVTKAPSPGGRRALRWMFVADLFHQVILPDQPPRMARHVPTDEPISPISQAGFRRHLRTLRLVVPGVLCVLVEQPEPPFRN